MAEAYLVEAVRTPVGRRGGGLGAVHPADLGAHVLRALVERTGIDPAAVEDVVFGCLDTVGPQAGDIARTCWLAAGLPEEVPSPDTASPRAPASTTSRCVARTRSGCCRRPSRPPRTH